LGLREGEVIVAIGRPEDIASDAVVHRVGGGSLGNLRLSSLDHQLTPPGFSVLLGRTPQEAAAQMRGAFPHSRKWRSTAQTVGTTTAAALRAAGFEIVPDQTSRFPNHARVIHPDGIAGFTDANLARLAQAFRETTGC
jgi:hypothetical protein